MYDLAAFGAMIADLGRTSSYARALEARITPGAVVLDVGTGPGIMALLACRAGARKVYAVEPDDVIQVAREAAAANGFVDRIQFLQASSLAIDLPERVDGIVSDLHGVLPLFGTSLLSLIDARDRFLKPRGWMIPVREDLFVAIVASPPRHAPLVEPWDNEYGFDFSSARLRTVNQWTKAAVAAREMVVEPQRWALLDYDTIRDPSVSGQASWTVGRATVAHGLCVWFDCDTAPGIRFSNSPISDERHVYGRGFFPWPHGTELRAGDTVRVQLRAAFVRPDYLWSWKTRVVDGASGSIKAAYDQSTFAGAPLPRERLRKRADTFVAQPKVDASIDRRILDLMADRIALAQIADIILGEFPGQFRDWKAALTRAGDLSERYSQ